MFFSGSSNHISKF